MFASLERRVPPALVAALAALGMSLTPGSERLLWPALALLLAGLGLLAVCYVQFYQARTTVNPFDSSATQALVVGGVYRFSRNPIYLAMALLAVAWGVWLMSWSTPLWLAGFVLFINRFQIQPEEAWLARHFGEQFGQYCQRVRRWL